MEYVVFNNDGEDDLSDGHTHLNGVLHDYTMCGITLDGDTETAGTFRMVEAKKLTCPQCIKVVRSCRDQRIRF